MDTLGTTVISLTMRSLASGALSLETLPRLVAWQLMRGMRPLRCMPCTMCDSKVRPSTGMAMPGN